MDVFCDPHEIAQRYGRYVIDLRRLFTFHGLACGEAENFNELAVKLEESRALRLDLPALLRNMRDLERGEMTADEMLTVLALASGGEDLVEGRVSSVGLTRTVGMLRMMLVGVGSWAEVNGAELGGERVPGKAAGGETAAKEERVFLELAIEELGVQLGEVKQRMRQLEPQVEAGLEPEGAGPGPAGGEADGRDAGSDGWMREEPVTREEPAVVAAYGVPAASEAADGWKQAASRAEEREAAARVAAEQERAALEAAAESEKAARELAARVAAERAVAEAAMLEQERARAWPLEERVSPLPTFSQTTTATSLETAQAESESSRRGRRLRLAGVAAGLLLATVGIYGSLRSASARADKEGSKREVSRPVADAGASGAGGGQGAGTAAATEAASAVPEKATTESAAVGEARGADEARAAKAPAAEHVVPKAVPRAEVAKAPARVVAKAVPRAEVAKAPARVVAKAVPRAELATVAPARAAAAAPDVAAKNRRDDAAVEAALAARPKDGKFLFVPADVMEKHLLSERKPVAPAEAQGGRGRVVLNAFIAKDGSVSRTDVVEGPPGLINSAMAAVSWRRYRPFLVKGQPAAVVTPVTVSYGGH